MSKRVKKIVAIIVVIAIIAVSYYVWSKIRGYETGVASLANVLASTSQRRIENTLTIVSDSSPYLALIATPVALYYDRTDLKVSPLLVLNSENNSRAVIRFLNLYKQLSVVTIGNVPTTLSSNERAWEAPTTFTLNITQSFDGSLKDISLNVGRHFWSRSDGVILIESTQEGYNQAVALLPIACYVNIPVIVTDVVDEKVANVLKGLGVKYSLVCGNIRGYGLTKRLVNVEETQDWTIAILRQRLLSNVSYITM
ncbi:MAG: hypothetical protein AB1485_02160, partial [Candidatus Thermoplasmatota archaeon]